VAKHSMNNSISGIFVCVSKASRTFTRDKGSCLKARPVSALSEATGRYFGEYLSSASTIFYYPAVFKTRFAQTVENRLEESSLADDDIPTKVPPNSCFRTNTDTGLA